MSFPIQNGINVEDSCLFTYGGRWYYFTAMISNPDISIGAQNLDNKNLELFEYTNEINTLCLYGNIIYNDLNGSISRFFNRQDNHVEVVCKQMKKVSDGGGSSEHPPLEMFVPAERSDGANIFAHSFIVQNIKILHREGQNVTYQISLISTAWYLLCSKIVFSNYPLTEPASAEKPRNGYRMLKMFLLKAFENAKEDFKVDDETFDNAANTTKELEIPYITSGNDTCFSIIKYIFDRLYWDGERTDTTVKFITFNPVINTYKCVDYSKDNTWSSCEKPFIILSMFETTYEQELFSVNNQLASIAGKNATTTYEDHFEKIIWSFDGKTNLLLPSGSLKEEDIAKLYNDKPDNFKEMCGVTTEDKYPSNLKPDWFKNENTYYSEIANWNRTYSIYHSLIDNLIKRDALVINTEGDVTHQPGACMGNILDRTIEKVPEMTPEQKKELYEKHRQLDGLFPILKVQHRYHLANSPKAPASYTENVVLGRNFILPPKV